MLTWWYVKNPLGFERIKDQEMNFGFMDLFLFLCAHQHDSAIHVAMYRVVVKIHG